MPPSLRIDRRAKLQFFAHFLVLVLGCSTAPAFTQDNWNLYTSPGGDFKVQLPGTVKNSLEKSSGRTMHMYQCESGDVACNVISSGIENSDAYFDRFKGGVIKGAVPESGAEHTEKKVSGSGWQGYLINFENPKRVASLLVAKADGKGVSYALASNLPYNSAEGRKFYDSLEVDPEAADKVHDGENTSPVYLVYFLIGGFLVFLVILAILIGAIVFVVRRSKRENP
jgi:hypothetical protein